ncbi:MAG: hypothetical protein HZA81_01180 [Candidatus Taylorbacteria bacterium]|nr:hypothetical protein [Candidatus Taylorbacteria bacterium]
MNKKLVSLIVLAVLLFGVAAFFGSGSVRGLSLSEMGPGNPWFLPLVLVSALIDSVNPCAISILLISIAFFVSMGFSRAGMLRAGGAYIAGIFAVYVLIGLGILQALSILNVPHFASKIGAVIIGILGILGVLGVLFPNFPVKFKIPNAAHGRIALLMKKASAPALFFLGGFIALCEFPCTGGPYLLILGLLHDSGTYVSGLWYLLAYNLVFVLPLAVILLIGSEQGLLEKVKAWKSAETGKAKLWGSVAMIALGIVIFIL